MSDTENDFMLPDVIKTVTVGLIDESSARYSSSPWTSFGLSPAKVLDKKDGLSFVRDMCALPFKEQARCHIPMYAVVINDDWVGSICFECNNIRIQHGDLFGGCQFDGESKPALALLERLRQAAGP